MEEVSKSKKDLFNERFSKRYPDVDLSNEDSYYDGIGRLLDDYENYESGSSLLRESMSRSPVFAEMIVAARGSDDFDPIVWMVENKGLDLRALAEDEEYSRKLADAHNKYLERLSRQDEIERQMSENMPASVAAIRAKASEMGLSDEQAEEVIGNLYKVMDDLIVGKIDPFYFEMMAKGMNYNTAVEAARDEGVAEGLNTKVEDKLRTLSTQRERPSGSQRPVREAVPPSDGPRNPFLA